MRRTPIALLVSLTAALAPLVPPVDVPGAAAVTVPPPAVYGPTLSATALQHLRSEWAATERLVSMARARGLSAQRLRGEWQQVAICEVGGNWSMTGPVYSGIGFLNSTWTAFGGTRYAPLAGRATRDQQIVVAMRVTGGWVPDQNGCSLGGW